MMMVNFCANGGVSIKNLTIKFGNDGVSIKIGAS